jgi:hypothetical protein
VAELTPFASVEDLSAFWREITEAEQPRAETLLLLASNRLRQMAEDAEIDLDAKVEASDIYKANVQWVVMEAVKRAMLMPTDQQPVDTASMTAGPYSENYKYSNPSGDLWFKKSELSAIGLAGKQRLGSISTTPNSDIYGS